MSTDLSNREEQIKDYMKEVLKSEFPETDLRNDGEFMEMFALPHIKLFEPLLTYIDRLKLMQSIDNAENMTQEEMDEVARSHYNARAMGELATGVAILVLDDIPTTGVMVLPEGSIEISSKSELLFKSKETITLNELSLSKYYDISSFTYRIPIIFNAVEPGARYNIGVGEISEVVKGNIPNLVEVINATNFTNGTDTETNIQLSNRLRAEAYAPNLGVERGYKRFIETFDDVEDNIVAGYGHPLMKRDIIGTVEVPGIKFNENIKDLHWGTKVDIYVRGETPTVVVNHLEIKEDEEGNKYVVLESVPVVDVIDIQLYSLEGEYDDPEINPETLFITNFVLVREEDFETKGTSEENAIVVMNDDRLRVGSYVEVSYRYNKLITDIHSVMYEEDNRPPTADVKIKEANKKYVFGSILVGMESSLGLRDSDRAAIRQELSSWMKQSTLGEEMQFSDLLEPISRNNPNSIEGLVDYVDLPFQFLTTENYNRNIFYCMNEANRNRLMEFKEGNAFLYRLFEKYKDTVTTYDFFDIFHSLTQSSGFDENIDDIGYYEGNWGSITNAFKQLRKMTLSSLATKRLSPAKKTLEENEHFVLGDVYIYESKEYDEHDWERMLSLVWNIANQSEEIDGNDVSSLYQLVIYVLAIMYMVTEDNVVTEKLYEFIRKLVVSTPIEFEYDI